MDPKGVGEWFYLCPGEHDHTLSLYPNKVWDAIVAELRSRRNQGRDAIQYEEWYYSQCCRLDMDAQGRVVLSKGQWDSVKMGKEITLAGAGDHIEVWRNYDKSEFLSTQRTGERRGGKEGRARGSAYH